MYRYSKLSAVLLVLALALGCACGATIYPKSLRTQSGTVSTTSLSALNAQDQSGNNDNWGKYVEFYGSRNAYQGVFTFDVSGINVDAVGAYTLDVNFRGPKRNAQVWEFEYLVGDDWVLAGDNADAASWKWSSLSFCGTTNFAELVQGGSLQLRLSSVTVDDDCDIDFLAITVTEGESSSGEATSAPTNPTDKATAKPTSKATPAPSHPTDKATAKPTSKATSAPTSKATAKPTSKATSAPTSKATAKPTSKATAAPTSKATAKPTSKATSAPAPGGRICPAGQVWAPAPGTTWQWQLTGTVSASKAWDVQMYDIDLFDNSADTIKDLHAKGIAVICYFSTQYEDWRPDASNWPKSVLGKGLDGWPGENWVDIRTDTVRNLIAARLDLALSKGCDGVEPDNVDEYSNSNGLGITAADQISFNTFVANEAHKRGLSVGLKNDLDQITQLISKYDWHLDEECNAYSECDYLKPVISAGKAAFGVDYESTAAKVCPKMVTAQNSWLMKNLDLDASGTQCCTYASGGCATKPAHRCVSYTTKRSEIDGSEELVEVVAEEQNIAETATFEAQHSAASTTINAAAIVGVAVVAALVL